MTCQRNFLLNFTRLSNYKKITSFLTFTKIIITATHTFTLLFTYIASFIFALAKYNKKDL